MRSCQIRSFFLALCMGLLVAAASVSACFAQSKAGSSLYLLDLPLDRLFRERRLLGQIFPGLVWRLDPGRCLRTILLLVAIERTLPTEFTGRSILDGILFRAH